MATHRTIPRQDLPPKLPAQSEFQGDLSEGNLMELLHRCAHPNPSIREEALDFLLHPPVADEASFTRDFLASVMKNPALIRHMPVPVADLLLDVVALTGAIPGGPPHADFFRRFVNCLAKRPFSTLLEKGVPLRPILPHISGRTLQVGGSPLRSPWKNRWRLLRKRILTMGRETSATALTLRDIKALRAKAGKRDPARDRGPRWLLVGRSLTLREWTDPRASAELNDSDHTQVASTEMRVQIRTVIPAPSAWGTMGSSAMRVWEELVKAQADELSAIRGLSRAVSKKTGRVVLGLHNATLAAAGGWAFEDVLASITPPALRKGFALAVEAREKELRSALKAAPVTPEALWARWHERLVVPQVRHGLWESRVRATFDPDWMAHYERELRLAEGILGGALPRGAEDEATRALPSAVAPHQRRAVGEILKWRHRRERLWSQGFPRLAACILEGQKLLASGSLDCLVLPWIDKFFISSRREADWEYLPLILQCLGNMGAQPLVLFWEDTSHASDPSFKLALNGMKKRGHPFRGIGVFDDGSSRREDALDIICREHRANRLFALRPLNDTHNPIPLYRLLGGREGHIFSHYDSSWKDNLCFIYAGTQVFPLLSVQCDMEPFPAWVVANHRRVPFGKAFRNRLRGRVLGFRDAIDNPLSLRYAEWANLL